LGTGPTPDKCDPKARNKVICAPIDMANMKNINNLITLRKMAFGIY